MHGVHDMKISNYFLMQQGYVGDLECKIDKLHHQLTDLGHSDYNARASDDDPTRGWSPWSDTSVRDD